MAFIPKQSVIQRGAIVYNKTVIHVPNGYFTVGHKFMVLSNPNTDEDDEACDTVSLQDLESGMDIKVDYVPTYNLSFTKD